MRIKWMTILIMSTLILSGCSESAPNEAEATQVETTIEAEGVTGVPERKSEVYGVVSKIIGNEITVKIVEKNSENNSENNVELTEEEKEAKRAARQSMSAEEKKADRDATMILTDEAVDVVIPVGTEIVTGSGTGTESGEMIKLELLDINKGTTIKIWLFEGGEGEAGIAEYVQVLSN